MNVTKRNEIQNLAASAICLALCMLLPLLAGQIPQFGNALSPMHIPVLLCGFICGPWYATAIGAAAPLLRFLMFGMPPVMPVGIAMCFELAAYGAMAGILYRVFPKKPAFVYVSLIIAMVLGRAVWGIAMWMLSSVAGTQFTWELFMTGAFINAVPGIILHIAVIPVLVMALKRVRIID